jgi:hypothetical protein
VEPAKCSRWQWALLVLASLAGLAIFGPACAHAAYEPAGTFGEELGGGRLLSEEVRAVAVNQSDGDTYAADAGEERIARFAPEGEFIEAWGWGVTTEAEALERCTSNCLPGKSGSGAGQFEAPTGVAVDQTTGNVYVLDRNRSVGVVQVFSGSGALIREFGSRGSAIPSDIQTPGGQNPIAIGPNGRVYIVDQGGELTGPRVMVFSDTGVFERELSFSGVVPQSVAVTNAGEVDVSGTGRVFHFTPSGTHDWTYETASILAMTADPESGELFIYVRNSNEFRRISDTGELVGVFAGVPEEEETHGLAINPQATLGTHRAGIVYATNGGGFPTGLLFAQPPLVLPTIGEESAMEVGSGSAVLKAHIDPHSSRVTYVFEYGTAGPCSLDPCDKVPERGATLTSETTTGSASVTLTGLTRDTRYFFRVLATNSLGTENGVDESFVTSGTPPEGLPDGRGYELVSPALKDGGEVFPPFAESGSCRECAPGGAFIMPMLAAPGGGSIAYMGQPFSGNSAVTPNEYIANRTAVGWRSESLSSTQFVNEGNQGYLLFSANLSRAVLAQERTLLSTEAPAGFQNLYLWLANRGTQPLVTAAPPHRSQNGGGDPFSIIFAGGNAGDENVEGLSHLMVAANDSLTAATIAAPAAPDPGPGEEAYELYEWINGTLRLVNVLPGNAQAAEHSYFGSGPIEGSFVRAATDNAMSDSGQRIFWTAGTGQLYVREGGQITREIPGPGHFLTAAANGAAVLLDSGSIYNLETETSVDLTAGKGGFLGTLGASASLARVYFVDDEALTPAIDVNANGEHAEAGADNLFAWNSETGLTFIGALLPQDNVFGPGGEVKGAWQARKSQRTAQVSPDGRFLVFASSASLTGNHNDILDAELGATCSGTGSARCAEVYEYDASSGNLSCASCSPSGTRPIGPASLTVPKSLGNMTAPHTLADDGLVTFDSQDAILPQDINGRVQDVYQYEPDNVGGCTRLGGCVSLISSGRGVSDSFDVTTTPSGSDEYFVSRGRYVTEDSDQLYDLYDARGAGGFPTGFQLPACLGEACKGPASADPQQAVQGSQSFTGPGNKRIHSCRRGFVRKHRRCVKKPRRVQHYGKKGRHGKSRAGRHGGGKP